MTVVSHETFHTKVAVFRIPPGENSLKKWNTSAENIVWKGHLRLCEQEVSDAGDTAASSAFEGLRLKLELYNPEVITQLLEDFVELESDVPWAEVWYNPFSESDMHYKISNDGSETIQVSPTSSRNYKIIAQLPGAGYHPLDSGEDTKGCILQIALGLRFEDEFTAILFAETLATYRRRFRNYQDKFLYDKHLLLLQNKILENLKIPVEELREPTPISDFEDDDFGNFVGSSYD